MTKTRKEQIIDQAKHEDSDGYFGFIAGAQWADKNPKEPLCHKFGDWGQFVESVNQMPGTWLPAALLTIVEACIDKKVFKAEDELHKAIEEKLHYMKNPSRKWEQL